MCGDGCEDDEVCIAEGLCESCDYEVDDSPGWFEASPTTSPSPRQNYVVAYDSTRDRVVLFGGNLAGGVPTYDETWEFDGCEWTEATPDTSPPARGNGCATFDSDRDVVIMFGGYDRTDWLNDTWEYDGENWREIAPDTTPPVRGYCSMTSDPDRGRAVMFAGTTGGVDGQLDDTWEYDGTNWIEITPDTSPTRRWASRMVYDPVDRVVVLFGGRAGGTYYNETWEYDGTTWGDVSPAISPIERYNHAMAYHQEREAIVLFGGRDPDYLNDTWMYDGGSWVEDPSDPSPGNRGQVDMVYDSRRHRVVLFGGYDGHGSLGDTWFYY